MQVPSSDGVSIELHDLGGDGPPVLIAHATGFCAQAYGPLASRLVGSHHVWALDFRAHGRSTLPASGDLTWEGMTDDVTAAIDAVADGPIFAFGHSMGGACLAAAERRRPGILAAAVLFEPIIFPSDWTEAPGSNPLSASARRRRASFASREEALARYASRPPLGWLRADALAAYVEHGFRDDPDGGVTLRCDPQHEAQVFEADGKPRIGQMAEVAAPMLVARGDRDGEIGPAGLAVAVADALPNGELRHYPHLNHFGPFQDPDTLGDDALAHFARWAPSA